MKRKWFSLSARVILLFMAMGNSSRATPPDHDRCGRLAGQVVASARIRLAEMMEAGQALPGPSGVFITIPARLCRVVGTVSVRPGEAVGIELWMPDRWNQRLEGVGSGGFGGSIATPALAQAVAQDFAAVSTDTGHHGAPFASRGAHLAWASDPITLEDWGRDAVHLMTVAAKAVLATYYQAALRHAYFNGCSTGGAEAMSEAEFFPVDYDGIHAGSPGMAYSRLIQSFLWTSVPSRRDLQAHLSDAALTLLHEAVLTACAAQKAVPGDRFLTMPMTCEFDPARLACPSRGSSATCLSQPQIDAARRIYAPVRDPRSGEEIYPGYARGGEADPDHAPGRFTVSGWYMNQDALANAVALPLLGSTVFRTSGWDGTQFDFDHDSELIARKLAPRIDATSPDLRAFAARGGKLVISQGWADAFNAPSLPISYLSAVRRLMGQPDWFLRLFMVPGMGHCGGGPGPNMFGGPGQPAEPQADARHNVMAALVDWVERRQAPEVLIAAHLEENDPHGRVTMQRPLCSYPRHAAYIGQGNPSQAENFTCR